MEILTMRGRGNVEGLKELISSLPSNLVMSEIGCYDYCEESPGVIKAVNEMFGKPDKVFSDASWIVKLK